jgi:hypothetical protein
MKRYSKEFDVDEEKSATERKKMLGKNRCPYHNHISVLTVT